MKRLTTGWIVIVTVLCAGLFAYPPQDTADPSAELVRAVTERWNALDVNGRLAKLPADASREELADVASTALFAALSDYVARSQDRNVGIYPKGGGTCHRFSPAYVTRVNGREYSCYGEDIVLLRRGSQVYWKDVGVSFGARTVSLQIGGPYDRSSEPDMFVPPPPVGSNPPPPPPPPGDLKKALARIVELEAERETARAERDTARAERDQAQRRLGEALTERDEARNAQAVAEGKLQAVTCSGPSIFGIRLPCRVNR
jgi:hypothetical protein